MSEQPGKRQDGALEPQRLRKVEELTLPSSFNELSLPGVVVTPYVKEKQLPPDRLVFVGMNSAAYTKVPLDRIGQVYTVGLAGCTGIAGVANIESGALAGVSHYDAMVDAIQRPSGICASERFMHQFIRRARNLGSSAIRFTVVYDRNQQQDPNYGKYGDNYDDWHYLNQLESFAEEAESDVEATLLSYEGMDIGHTLVANVNRDSQLSVEFR